MMHRIKTDVYIRLYSGHFSPTLLLQNKVIKNNYTSILTITFQNSIKKF